MVAIRLVAIGLVLVLSVPALLAPGTAAQGRKVLVVAQAGDIDSLDNEKALGPSKNAIILCTDWQYLAFKPVQLKSGLWTVDTNVLVPRIVEKWEERALPNGRYQYAFQIKRGLKHQSGNPVTAHDIVFSMQRRQAFKRDTLERTLGRFEANKDLAVPDDYTLQINAAGVAPLLFKSVMTQRNLYDSKRVKELAGASDPWGEEYLKKNCVGGGPYRLSKWTPGVEMVFDRWPDWWGNQTWEKTTVDQIVLRVVPSVETRALLLQRGEVDIALDMPPREIDRLRSVQGVKILSYPSQNMLYVGINPVIKPFDNVKVRKAMALAFPYQTAIEQVFRGDARRLNGPVPTGVALARKVAAYSTDLNKAKGLLTEAGVPGGTEIALTLDAKFQTHEDLAVLYKANLEQLGLRVNIQKMPSAQFNTETRAKRIAFFFYEALWWVPDPLYILSLSFESKAHTNVSNYQNAQVDDMLAKALETADEKQRLRLLEQVQNFVIDDVGWVTVAQPNFNLAVRANIDRYVHQNTELHHLWLVQKK
ncbi:MAG: ABC transporter substrate-binding protein [Armatimonadota bacterium]|nr:ABC transporter substrate-binding protein [Armatimonadota bacterium]